MEIQEKIRKIKKLSTILRLFCKALLLAISFVGLASLVALIFGIGGVNYSSNVLRSSDLTIGHRLLLIGMTCLKFGVLFKGVFHLYRLFGDYSRGEIFTRESVGQIRQFSIACLLWDLVNFSWDGLWFGVLANPPRTFHGHFEAFGLGIVFFVIAWFMDMAVDIREENQLTI